MTESQAQHTNTQQNSKQKQSEYAKKWANENKTKIAKSVKEWEKKNPHKLAAHQYIKREIYNKGIQPGACCIGNGNCSDKVDAHHSDYTKLDQIIWLCRKHHKAWHRLFVAVGGE